MSHAMTACVYCQKPVVTDPDVLADGRLIHAACKERITGVTRRRTTPPQGMAASRTPSQGTAAARTLPQGTAAARTPPRAATAQVAPRKALEAEVDADADP